MTLPTPLLKAISKGLNQWLDLDPNNVSRLTSLSDKTIRLHIKEIDTAYDIYFHAQHVQISAATTQPAHTHIKTSLMTLTKLIMGTDHIPGGEEGITITGDVKLGQQFKTLFDETHIDWEHHLANYIGDFPAYMLSKAKERSQQWTKKNLHHFAHDLKDYLQEEIAYLPTHCEVDTFLAHVDTLRQDADRLHARLHLLEQHLTKDS